MTCKNTVSIWPFTSVEVHICLERSNFADLSGKMLNWELSTLFSSAHDANFKVISLERKVGRQRKCIAGQRQVFMLKIETNYSILSK